MPNHNSPNRSTQLSSETFHEGPNLTSCDVFVTRVAESGEKSPELQIVGRRQRRKAFAAIPEEKTFLLVIEDSEFNGSVNSEK